MTEPATPPLQLGVPIPALLWASVEDALRVNMRLLAKDIAKTLGVSDAPLLESLQVEKIRPYIFEESADKEQDMRCDFYCQRPDAPAIMQRCQQPVFWGATNSGTCRCTEHMYATKNPRPSGLPRGRALPKEEFDEDDQLPAAFLTEENRLVDGSCEARGSYTPAAKRLFIFNVEADE